MLKLTQPSVTPSTGQSKKSKLISGDYFPAELPEATAKKVPKINTKSAEEQSAPASLRVCPVEQTLLTSFAPASLPGNIKLRQGRNPLPWKRMFPQQQICL